MNLDLINTYLVGIFMYKVYHKNVPALFDVFFGTITIYMITTQEQPIICMCH